MSNAGFPADFLDAMDRHWRDAELLRRKERLANADHLYGLSAECGLKAIMQRLGMEMKNNVPRFRDDRKHINGLWDRYESYRSRSNNYASSSYCLGSIIIPLQIGMLVIAMPVVTTSQETGWRSIGQGQGM